MHWRQFIELSPIGECPQNVLTKVHSTFVNYLSRVRCRGVSSGFPSQEPRICCGFSFLRIREPEIDYGFLFLGTRVLEDLGLEIRADFPFLETRMGSSFSGTRKPVVTCSKIEDRLYPDICVSKNTQKRFFRRVPDFVRNGNPDTSSPVCDIPIGELPTSLSVIRKVEVARRKF